MRVERFDLEGLRRDRDQLWAEAAAREAGGESIRLPENLWPAAAAEQQQRVVENPFVSVLERVLRESNELAYDELAVGELVVGELVDGELMEGMIAAEDVWTIVGVRPAQRTQDNNEKLGDAMKQLGWERTRLRVGAGKRSYAYTRGPKPYRHIVVELMSSRDGAPAQPVAMYQTLKPSY